MRLPTAAPVRSRSRVLLETLEPRILYSADLAAVAGVVGATGAELGLTQELRLQTTAATTAAPATTATAVEIAFVDLGVPEAGTLVSGLQAQREHGRLIEIVTFTDAEDGLDCIGQTLAERASEGVRFDAVHVFSHGRAGAVQLGSATLDADSLLRRAGEIAGWGRALSGQADLMVYGCDVADGAGGVFLIEGLAALTGADVAASDDLTGATALGGDWVLEQHTGQIESSVALDTATQQAWVGTLSGEIAVNTTTAGSQTTTTETRGSQQTVAMDAAGNYTVVWTSSGQDGGGRGVYARRFAFDGTPLTGEIRVNTTTADQQQNARIVGDSAGKFAVVWSSSNQDGTSSSVYFRRFDANGTALTGEIRANAYATGSQSNAVIGMNTTNGDVVVAWEGDGVDGQSVFFRRFAQNGTAIDTVDQLVTAPGNLSGEHDPAVAMNASGQFVVAWAGADHVYCQRFDSAGVASGSQVQMDTNLGGGTGSLPAIAIDAAGNFIGVYRKDVANIGLWVCTQATVFGSVMEVRQSIASGDATSASIGIGANGSAVVVYQMTGDGDKLGVYARKLSASKAVSGVAVQINETTAKDQLSASVAVHDMDRFVVAWSGEGAVDKDGVFARSFAPANTPPVISTNGGLGTAAVSVAENTTAVTTVGATDSDWPTPTLAYSIAGGADQAKFSINSVTGALRFTAAPDFELPGDANGDNVYEVVVQSSDSLLSGTQALSVTVTNVADQVVAVDDTVTTVYQTAVTVDVRANDQIGIGPLLTVLDLVQPAHGTAAISSGQIVYTPNAGFVGTDTLQYRVIDHSEGLTDYWPLDETPVAVTTNPTSVAGVHGKALQFDGVDDRYGLSGVTYTSEFTLSYWFKLASNSGTGYQYLYAHGAAGTLNSLNTYFIQDATATASGIKDVLRTSLVDGNDAFAIANTSALDIPATGLADNQWHQYTLTTKTGAGSAVYIDGIQRASSLTQGGDAIAPSGAVFLGANTTLSSTRFLAGALDDVQLYNRTTPAVAVAAMASGPGDIGTLVVTVTPLNTQAPVITSDGGGNVGTLTVAENSAAVTTFTATDADVGHPALVYSIVGGADQALFRIDSASGVVSFLSAPDFENPADVGRDNLYAVDVQVSDGVHASVQALQVAVVGVNEYPISSVTDTDATLDEVDENATLGTTVGLTASATDADASNNTVTYTLDDTDSGRFAIHSASGVVTVAGLLNAEPATLHRIIVRATSSDGSSQTQTYVIAVRDLDEFDVTPSTDADTAANTVLESAAIGSSVGITASASDADVTNSTVAYTLIDDAGGRFAIDASTGTVTVARALDAEAGLSQNVTVQARSTDGSVSSTSFTIAVQDVNEFAVGPISDANTATESVREDAAVGTAVGYQAQATDADATNSTVAYTLTDDAGGRFAIDASTGTVTVARALDAETGLSQSVTVQARSTDGSVSSTSFTIAVQDVNEFAVGTLTDLDPAAESVREDAAVGTAVGYQAQATDADATNSAVTYALTIDGNGYFAIDASTGTVTVARALDAEAGLSQSVTVQARSADGSVSTQNFTIAVQDVNEFAVGTLTDLDPAAETVREDAAVGTAVGFQAKATDNDVTNSAITYALTSDAGGRFAIDASTGTVTVARALDAETAVAHTVTVQARSADGSVSSQDVTIAVQDVNEFAIGPISDANTATESVREDAAVGTAVGYQAQAIDADATNSTVAYTLTDDAGGRFAIDASTGTVTVARALDAETGLSQSVTVQARSIDGSVSSTSFTIAVQDVNEFAVGTLTDLDPAAESVREDAAVGTAVGYQAQATDADATNSTVAYTLTDDAGGRFAIDASTGTVTVARALDAETAVAHTVTAQARSADGSVSSQSFTITVQDADEFDATVPTDNDAAVNTVQNIDAVGTAVGITAWSRDADLTLNQITYTLLDDAGGRFAIDASTGVVTLARSITTDTNTLQTLLVQAASADSSVATVRFSVAITPVNLFAPVIGSDGGGATAALTVQENTTAVTTVTATDADVAPGPLTYTLVGGADQALFTLDASTGVLRFVAAPDAERPRDAGADNGYEVTVQASDGVRFDTQALTLTVADVNEFAIGALHDTDTTTNTVQENAAIGTTVGVQMRADDADATQSTVTYRLDTSSGGLFAINASTGVLTVAGLLDAETALVHTVTVRATSADGSTTTLTVSIAVQDVNEYGITPVTDNDPQANRVREDDPVGTVVGITASAQDRDATNHVVSYALTDDAGGRFSIEASSGVITIARALDAEFAQVHSLTVRALSSDGSAQFLATTVAVQDVNEVPVGPISDTDAAPDSVAENAAIGTRIGFTAQASDGDVTNNTVTYALLDNAGGRFAIDANTGVITVAAALDAEAAQQHTLRVQATSSDHSQSIQSLTVAVTDVDEFDLMRMDDTDAAPNTVAENAVVGTAVGVRAESVDGDVTRNLVTYRLDNDAGGRFAIDANTGVVTVAGGLNAEASLQHTLTVRATSADGSAWTQDFTVDVTDVNEFGVARLADADAQPDAVLENAAVGTAVGVQGSAKDDDATTSTVTYTLDDSAGGRFAVDASTGAVTLARSVQEEGVASRGIVLRATSADGSSMAMAFTIAITAVNDATPVITSDGGGATAALSVQEGQTAVTQVQAQDADLPAETLRYTLAGGVDAAWFTLDPVSGALRFTAAPDAETPLDQGADNVYDLTVQVSDGLHTAAQTLRITVQPLNDTAPVITSDGGGATALRHVAENTLDITQVQARDADLPADTLTYTVAGGADAALFTVDARTGALRWVAAPDRETPRDVGADGTYDVTVSASDGLHSVSQALTIVVDNVDEAPRLDTNALAILEGGTARPVLVASDVDTPAARLVYTVQTLSGGRFEQVAVPGVAVTRFTQAEADAGAIRFVADGGEAAPVYTLALADDTTTLAAQAAVVAFTPVNDVPVVAAVDLGTVAEDTARVITAAELLAGATDAEGDTLTVSTLRLAAGEGTLTDLGGGRWRFDPAADWHGAVALAGMVSDGQAGTALAASLQVRAVNDAPRIVSGGGAATLALDQAENTATVTTVVGTDVDADVRLHYAVVGGADAARFQIDAATGALSFRQAPDREQPTDANGDNRYDVTVEVSDGVLTAQQALQITVTNVDEAPVVRRNVLLLSDGTVTLVLQASDPDTPATALTYRVDAVAGGQFERVVAPGTVVQVFTQAELDAAQVVWVAPVGSTAASYALRLSDGVSEVQIGSPALERQSATAAATATELTLVGLAAGDAAVVPSAGAASSAATLAAAIDSTRRAAAREMPALAADDASLGLGKTAQPEQAAVSRGSRVVDVAAAVTRMVAARGGSALTTAMAVAVAVQGGELALDLPSESAEAPKQLGTNLNSLSVRTGTALAEQLDRLRQEVGEAHQAGMVSLASTALISTGVSVGYVIWLVRGGVLMTSLMSVVPAWAGMDPLPVLAEMRRTGGGGAGTDGADDGGEDDPIEKLFSKARRLLVRPVAGLASAPAPAPDLPETPA